VRLPGLFQRTPAASGAPARGWSRLPGQPILPLALLLALAFPIVPEKTLATQILVFGLFAMSYNILLGYAGLLAFGHATFFGLGAYGTALVLKWWQPHLLLAMLAGILLATLVATSWCSSSSSRRAA
jgi:branched-chain amino acid transport system permease protein